MGQKPVDKNFLVDTEDYYGSIENSESYKGVFHLIIMQIPLDILCPGLHSAR